MKRYFLVFLVGLGLAAEAVSGEPASSTALEPTQAPVQATLGGVALQVVFAGSAPGFIGVNQVNAVIPAEARTGRLKLSTRGVDSNEVQVVVQ